MRIRWIVCAKRTWVSSSFLKSATTSHFVLKTWKLQSDFPPLNLTFPPFSSCRHAPYFPSVMSAALAILSAGVILGWLIVFGCSWVLGLSTPWPRITGRVTVGNAAQLNQASQSEHGQGLWDYLVLRGLVRSCWELVKEATLYIDIIWIAYLNEKINTSLI